MTDNESKRWEKHAKKAEAYLVDILGNPDVSFVQRIKAAELILNRYYGRPAIGEGAPEDGPRDINIDWGGHPEYGI